MGATKSKNVPFPVGSLKLRCYAEKDKDGTWFTACLELCLAAQADTFEEAKKKLHEMIHDYVLEALTIDREYINDLIPRKSPWHFFVKYYFYSFLSKVLKFKNNFSKSHKLYYDALPLNV